MSLNTLTLGVLLAPWVLFLGWEIYVLIRRASDHGVGTISMVARDYAHRLTCLVYVWGMCATHWFWPSPFYAPLLANVMAWVLLVCLLIQDVVVWPHPRSEWPLWLKIQRHPALTLGAGLLSGALLFPQKALPW